MATSKVKAAGPEVFEFDLPEGDVELEVSHVIRIRKDEYRVLAEPHQWHLLRMSSDPASLVRAYIHPEDYPKMDNFLQGLRKMPEGGWEKLISMITEKPTGHPTNGSSASTGT